MAKFVLDFDDESDTPDKHSEREVQDKPSEEK